MANEERINVLFEELVPPMGKCNSMAGEMVRAVSRIVYRYWNDGDRIGFGYGNETCNAPARYLINHGNDEIANLVRDMNMYSDNIYTMCIDRLCGLVADMIENNLSLREKETEDMYDYEEEEDYDYEEDDEDDWDDEWE